MNGQFRTTEVQEHSKALTNTVASTVTNFVTFITKTAVASHCVHTLTTNLTIVRIFIAFIHI